MIDFARFIELVKGGLLSPKSTWEGYWKGQPGWLATAKDLTIPLYVVGFVLAAVLGALFGSMAYLVMSGGGGIGGFLKFVVVSLVQGAIGFLVGSFILKLLSGVFGGKDDINGAFAALSFAAIAAVSGQVLSMIPGIGLLLMFAMSIYGLVLLYQNIPVFLEVPQAKRVLHFISFILSMFVLGIVLSALFVGSAGMPQVGAYDGARPDRLAAAQQDRTQAPVQITREQLLAYIDVTRKIGQRTTQHYSNASNLATAFPSKGHMSDKAYDTASVLNDTEQLRDIERQVLLAEGWEPDDYTALRIRISQELVRLNSKTGEASPAVQDLYQELLAANAPQLRRY